MSDKYYSTPEGKDSELWQIANRRAAFKKSFAVYIIVNAFLWCIWYFTDASHNGIPWPIWPTLGWGIGITFKYSEAYLSNGRNTVDAQYEKLKNKIEKK